MTTDFQPTAADLPSFPGARSGRCPFNPPAAYAEWREQDGLQKVQLGDGKNAWAISRYEDVRAVLGDTRFSADVMDLGADAFPRMDDPEHARLRRMLTGEFTIKRVEKMRTEIEAMTNEVLDAMVAKGQPAELVHDFALPIPSLVISLLLGVPYEDHPLFQDHASTINQVDATPEEKGAASRALFQYLYSLVLRKQQEPGDDLISRLLADQVAKGELDLQGVAMNGIILLVAGHETTGNMIGLSTLTLLEHPEIATRIRDAEDRVTLANAVEELLRFLTIAQDAVTRVATEDISVGGQLVRTGELVTINLPAANRDSTFLDQPDVLDIDHNVRAHVAFGYGIHQCLGQNLARLELQIVLPTLLRRLPDLRLAVPLEEIELRENQSVYGVHALPVAW